ncbi:MAG TPA: Hsp20/alpha crystallin family protein [Longimicrobiaceae bacterium]|nr:Hsp20/alpha crystallin family protein [Longimicrobiaceae bacterium]
MAITPYRPATDPFDQLWNTFLNPGGHTRGEGLLRAPETDVMETENEIKVVSDIPGLHPEDIDIDVENNVLTIRGERKEEHQEGDEGTYHLAERRYGQFSRSFVLPRDVDQEHIQARFDDGVLTVTIPKSEKARRRRIEVTGNNQGGQGQQMS